MKYELETPAEKVIVIKCYITEMEYSLQFVHNKPENMFEYLHRTYLDPILQQEEDINGFSIAMKVDKWQIGEKRDDGMYQLAFIGSFRRFSKEELVEFVTDEYGDTVEYRTTTLTEETNEETNSLDVIA